MSHHRVMFVEPLARFVLEVLPWALSGLIGLYLLWGLCLAPDHARPGLGHIAEHAVPAGPVAGPGIATKGTANVDARRAGESWS